MEAITTKIVEVWAKPKLQLIYRWYGGANDEYVVQTPLGELRAGSWSDIVNLDLIFQLLYRKKHISKPITPESSWEEIEEDIAYLMLTDVPLRDLAFSDEDWEPPCAICRS